MAVLKEFSQKAPPPRLVLLAECAGVTLTPNTRELLNRLSAFVQWAGRYPIPMKEEQADFERTTRDADLEDVQRFIASLK
jgi:hypothetical protein